MNRLSMHLRAVPCRSCVLRKCLERNRWPSCNPFNFCCQLRLGTFSDCAIKRSQQECKFFRDSAFLEVAGKLLFCERLMTDGIANDICQDSRNVGVAE